MAKEAPSPHEVGLAPLDTNSVFQCLRGKVDYCLGGYWILFAKCKLETNFKFLSMNLNSFFVVTC